MEPNMKGTVPPAMDMASHLTDVMMKVYDELDGAKEYINAAIAHKPVNSEAAESFYVFSTQELQHGETLMKIITSSLEKMKSGGDECYDTLSKVWSHMKERQIGYAAWIRQMQAQYKK